MPFSIKSCHQDGFDIIILKDEHTQSMVEIIPACGAILHGFSVLNKGSYLNIIEHYQNLDDFKTNVETKGFRSCKLSPFACRIKDASYNFNQQKYQLNKFILNGDALHGLLYDGVFTIIDRDANQEFARIELLHQYLGTDKGFPFRYDCVICYKLMPGNTLVIETSITNKEEHSIPIQDGWHPYFTFGKQIDALKLQLQTSRKIELDATLIPTGKTIPSKEFEIFRNIDQTVFDDCFELNLVAGQPACILKDAENNLQVEIYPDKTYPYLQLFTPANRNSIAIENLSAIPDAFNNEVGLTTLPAHTCNKFTTTYKITLLN